MFIDAHTHQKNPVHPSLVMGKHALGIHPWDVKSPFDRDSLLIEFRKIENEEMFAIGECGLDRARSGLADIIEQSEVFQWHLELAKKTNLPVIVHSVRAHSDIVGILKNHQWKIPLMLHDFSGNEQQIAEFLKYPVTFSLGKRIFNDHDLIKKIPLENLLLETDDQLEIGIEDLYKKAAEILNIEVSILEGLLEKNFLNFFSHANDVRSADFINNFR
jgi:TatD DNase family protein